MRDVVVILMTLGFFALCVVYVGLCDRIVGPDEQDANIAPANGAGATEVSSLDGPDGADVDPALLAPGGSNVGRTGAPGVTR